MYLIFSIVLQVCQERVSLKPAINTKIRLLVSVARFVGQTHACAIAQHEPLLSVHSLLLYEYHYAPLLENIHNLIRQCIRDFMCVSMYLIN